MNEVLLETLVDTVSNNGKEILEVKELVKALPDYSPALSNLDSRMDGIAKTVQDLPNRISMPVAEILALKNQLQEHSGQLAIPLTKEVRHEHHLSKPLLWYIALSLVILGLLFLLYYTWDKASQHEENDIKYRFLKVFQEAGGKSFLHDLDSQYRANPDQFRKETIEKEEHDKEQLEKLQRLQEQQEGVKQLEQEIQAPIIQPGKKAKLNRSGK